MISCTCIYGLLLDTNEISFYSCSAGHTTAPVAISESDLIGEMDRNGIGTDATIAGHIKTIQQREYALKNASGQFVPTKLGLALVEGAYVCALSRPHGVALDAHCCTACLKAYRTLQSVATPSHHILHYIISYVVRYRITIPCCVTH